MPGSQSWSPDCRILFPSIAGQASWVVDLVLCYGPSMRWMLVHSASVLVICRIALNRFERSRPTRPWPNETGRNVDYCLGNTDTVVVWTVLVWDGDDGDSPRFALSTRALALLNLGSRTIPGLSARSLVQGWRCDYHTACPERPKEGDGKRQVGAGCAALRCDMRSQLA